MFMGTERVPDNQFDMLMERGGGANNASTSNDRTNYYSWGPSLAVADAAVARRRPARGTSAAP
jgi:hypothetical protein